MAKQPERALLKELQSLIARYATDQTLPQLLPNILLMSSTTPTQPKALVTEPVFVMVAQGAKRSVLVDQSFDYHAGQYLIISVDLPIHGCVVRASETEPYLAVGMTLKPESIAKLLLETGTPPVPRSERPGIAVSNASDELVDPVVRLLRLLERPEDIPVLLPSIEREILWRLMSGDQGCLLRQLGLADSRMSQIGRSIKWLRSHYCEPMKIEDLAEIAGMSMTSFHRHFRAITAMSPLQYQKRIRLQEARTRLLTGKEDMATIGYKVGYESPSQFSREYKRQFGLPPGEDSGRLRSAHEIGETVVRSAPFLMPRR